jgi:poly(3-hydroxybutyrate) depolymerase
MLFERVTTGLALSALATLALVSCVNSETNIDDADGGTAAGSGGASGSTTVGGTTGNGGTTSNGGTISNGGTTSNGGASGTTSTGGTVATGGASGGGGVSGAAGSPAGNGGTAAGQGGAAGAPAGNGGMAGGAAGSGATSGGSGTAGGGAGGSGGDAVAPSTGCGKAATIMNGRASIDVNGDMREYIIAVPTNYDQNKPYRLIFGWHPWGGSAQQIAQQGYFGLSTASMGQAVLVAPEGEDYQDNGLGWGNASGRDVAFAHAMMDRFTAGLCIDQNRIFSTGFSFGAMFSFTLACTADSRQRAIAPMAGNSTTSGRCADGTRSVATMGFVGTTDSLLSVHRQAIQIFVDRNECTSMTMAANPNWCDDAAAQFDPCTCVTYQGCKAGYPVVECEYNAGHQFAPSAGPALWRFFSQF